MHKAQSLTSLCVTVLLSACAQTGAPPQPAPPQAAASRFTSTQQAQLEACYAAARAPGLSVRTVVLYMAREQRIVFADVDLPNDPELAACLRDAIIGWPAFLPSQGDELSTGGFGVSLGPPPTEPAERPSLQAVRERHRRMTLAALESGALHPSDPHVREILNPPPPWPGPAELQDLESCYESARVRQPDLVVHGDVQYLARGADILIADVRMPEDPQLGACLERRIENWTSPFPKDSPENTLLSSFFLNVGEPPEFPDGVATWESERVRREALFQRAVERKLIAADDPAITAFTLPARAVTK